MKAIVRDRYGSPDVLELRDIDWPVAGGSGTLAIAAAVKASLPCRDGIAVWGARRRRLVLGSGHRLVACSHASRVSRGQIRGQP
jgi:hypothetical protein